MYDFERFGSRSTLVEICDYGDVFSEFLDTVEATDREFLIKTADELIDLHININQPNEKRASLAEFMPQFEEIEERFGHDAEKISVFLAKLFRMVSAYFVTNLTDTLNEVYLSGLFIALRTSEFENVFLRTGTSDKESLLRLVENILLWRNILKAFSFEGNLPYPFDQVDFSNEEWKLLIEEAENFSHSITSNFNIDAVFSQLEHILLTECPEALMMTADELKIQVNAMPAYLELLESFEKRLLESGEKSDLEGLESLVWKITNLLNARYANRIKHGNPVTLPIKTEIEKNIRLKNANSPDILKALFEVAKGALSEGKIDDEQIAEFINMNEPYIVITAKVVTDEFGRQGIKIEIMDRGTPLPEVLVEMAHSQSIDPINLISDRGVTFARNGEGADYRHKGIGLHVARKIIKQHNGDISVENMPCKDGVKFTVMLPEEGMDSPYNYSFSDPKLPWNITGSNTVRMLPAEAEPEPYEVVIETAGAIDKAIPKD